jgi:hypothetical protein
MTELQSGILDYIAGVACFLVGWLYRGLFDAHKRRERRVMALEAETLASQSRDGRG